MKDLNEIKYKTNRFDEEGHPIYITEAEFREHGIYTISPEEQVTPKEEEKKRKKLNIPLFIKSILTTLLTLLFEFPFGFAAVQILMIGVASLPTDKVEGIGLIILMTGAFLLILVIAILMGYSCYKKRIRRSCNVTHSNENSDGISGEYITFGHTRNDGSTVTYIYKRK